MGNMPAIDKRMFTIRVSIETCRKAEAKYHKDGDASWRESIIRALEDATRDYQLTAEDYRAIASEIEANTEKRNGNANR